MLVSENTGQGARQWGIGDNLDIMREHVPDESVDLTYLDLRSTARPL
ncbi:MAG: hypothetical protein Q8P50_13405 [Bacillota bacterium]|nr:hypothetical protein [Bacillota bacterium]